MLGLGLSLPQGAVRRLGAGVAIPAPTPPTGFVFLTDTDGAYLVDSDGAYLVEPI